MDRHAGRKAGWLGLLHAAVGAVCACTGWVHLVGSFSIFALGAKAMYMYRYLGA